MGRVLQEVVITVATVGFDRETEKRTVYPRFYRVKGLPRPSTMNQIENRRVMPHESVMTGTKVTLRTTKRVFIDDPATKTEFWMDMKKKFVQRGRLDARGRDHALEMFIMDVKQLADPKKIKYRCWEILPLQLVVVQDGVLWRWQWKQQYGISDCEYIACNARVEKDNPKSGYLWNPEEDGFIAEGIFVKDGQKEPELTVKEYIEDPFEGVPAVDITEITAREAAEHEGDEEEPQLPFRKDRFGRNKRRGKGAERQSSRSNDNSDNEIWID